MIDNKKDQIIKELKQKLRDGEKVFLNDETSSTLRQSFSVLGTEYKCYIKLEEGLLSKFSNDKFDKKLEIEEVAKILNEIAERKVKELEELDAVKSFLDN
ncbi:hypothetical protein [Neobacillus sp. D3-1R]|uniref:hypothetical protein n=1 Tax=Neobacillus sp. D3-1R TaxID=3445778 RepID=UPI003FA195BC